MGLLFVSDANTPPPLALVPQFEHLLVDLMRQEGRAAKEKKVRMSNYLQAKLS